MHAVLHRKDAAEALKRLFATASMRQEPDLLTVKNHLIDCEMALVEGLDGHGAQQEADTLRRDLAETRKRLDEMAHENDRLRMALQRVSLVVDRAIGGDEK